MSQSVPGADRSILLGKLYGTLKYNVAIQAVALRDGKAYFSPTEMITFVTPSFDVHGGVHLKFEDIPNSPAVRLRFHI